MIKYCWLEVFIKLIHTSVYMITNLPYSNYILSFKVIFYTTEDILEISS